MVFKLSLARTICFTCTKLLPRGSHEWPVASAACSIAFASFAAVAASGASGDSDTGATITVASARGCRFPCFQASVASFVIKF